MARFRPDQALNDVRCYHVDGVKRKKDSFTVISDSLPLILHEYSHGSKPYVQLLSIVGKVD